MKTKRTCGRPSTRAHADTRGHTRTHAGTRGHTRHDETTSASVINPVKSTHSSHHLLFALASHRCSNARRAPLIGYVGLSALLGELGTVSGESGMEAPLARGSRPLQRQASKLKRRGAPPFINTCIAHAPRRSAPASLPLFNYPPLPRPSYLSYPSLPFTSHPPANSSSSSSSSSSSHTPSQPRGLMHLR
jgi:hypothetical protein